MRRKSWRYAAPLLFCKHMAMGDSQFGKPADTDDADLDPSLLQSPFAGGLSRRQIDECRRFWMDEVSAQGGLSFDALDGLLTALAILPNPQAPARWAPIALGPTLFASSGSARETALAWLYRFGAHVSARVRKDPDVHRDESLPEFDFLPGSDSESDSEAERRTAAAWSAGAAQGLALDPDGIAAISADDHLRNWLAPFILLGRTGMQEGHVFSVSERRQLMRAATYSAYRLWKFAQPYRERGGLTRAPAVAAAGRNDPCPCGSGIKYKKCHGATRH